MARVDSKENARLSGRNHGSRVTSSLDTALELVSTQGGALIRAMDGPTFSDKKRRWVKITGTPRHFSLVVMRNTAGVPAQDAQTYHARGRVEIVHVTGRYERLSRAELDRSGDAVRYRGTNLEQMLALAFLKLGMELRDPTRGPKRARSLDGKGRA